MLCASKTDLCSNRRRYCLRKFFLFFILGLTFFSQSLFSTEVFDTAFSGNFIQPDQQSGFEAEHYEANVGRKMLRGAENFFLGFLEVPHSIKTEFAQQKADYLDPGVLAFSKGFVDGVGKTAYRMGVGFYEFFSSPIPQRPILPDLEQTLL